MPRLATRQADRDRWRETVRSCWWSSNIFVDLIEFVCEFQHFKKPIFDLAFD